MRPRPLLIYGKPGVWELCYALPEREIPRGEEKLARQLSGGACPPAVWRALAASSVEANRNSPLLEIAGTHTKHRTSLFSNRNKTSTSGNVAPCEAQSRRKFSRSIERAWPLASSTS